MTAPLAPDPTARPRYSPTVIHAAALGALALLAAVAYSNALGGAFVFDDTKHVRDNPLIRDLGNYLWGDAGRRGMPSRWVGYLTFALNYRAGGLAVGGYHAVNVAIHALNAALVYVLVVLTFRTTRVRASSLAPAAPAVAVLSAALFVTHPIQTQAVAYVVQRLTSLAALFYLSAVTLYAAWRLRLERGAAGRGGIALYAGALACALLAMRTKEIAFTLPFAIVLYELAFFDRARRPWRALLPFVATAAIIPLTLLGGAHGPAAISEATRVQTSIGRLQYVTTEIAVVVTYLSLLLLPVGQNVDYDYPLYTSLLQPEVALSALVLGALAAAAAYLWYRTRAAEPRPLDGGARLAAFCVGWWFLTLAVESLVPIVDVINEHRVYLPSVGFFVPCGAGLVLFARRFFPAREARAALSAGAVLVAVLAGATLHRNLVWRDAVSLWADSASKSPGKARPFMNLGAALVEEGRRELAIGPFRRAIENDPSAPWSRAQLGATLLFLGRADEAEPLLREAVRLRDDYPEATFNLAVLLWRSGRLDEARRVFRRFLEIAPPAMAEARKLAAARAASL